MSVLGGGNGLKFEVGTTHSGTIVGIREQQARDFKTKEPKTFKDGNPIMEAVLTIKKADGTTGDLYISSRRMREAIKTAFREAGAFDVAELDEISVTCTGIDAANRDAKLYTATYSVFDPTA